MAGARPSAYAKIRVAAKKDGTLTAWDWLSGPIIAAVALGSCGWWMADRRAKSLWAAIRT